MKKVFYIIFPLLIATSCTSSGEKPRPDNWLGEWNAKWETLPESYPGLENVDFFMNGSFLFTSDSLTVTANGFEGSIFGSDTLAHTQIWYVQNDTLFLLSDPEMQGMTYVVKSEVKDTIQLQLLDDMFVTLTK